MKGNVTLRERTLPSGNRALYLDICHDGKRERESLGIILKPGNDRETRQANRKQRELAEAIAARRLLDMRTERYGLPSDRSDTLVYAYAQKWLQRSGVTQGTINLDIRMIAWMRAYDGSDGLTFRDIDMAWCQGFIDSLNKPATYGKPLKEASKGTVWNRFKAFIHYAMNNDIITKDPMKKLSPFRKSRESIRTYLTAEELARLAQTPIKRKREWFKRMFLFSCFTGLRYSDVSALIWGEVSADGDRVTFRQQKTGGLQYLDINSQAQSLLGERGKDRERVFGIISSNIRGNWLAEWAADAGIDKHLTFHSSRHTFATLMLKATDNIALVSKLLGHADVSTTMIYAKITDRQKKEAVDKLPKIL